ncbi:protein Wnt [Elysia marginata]|uniref:Protein Wnt n=1 Tax=Elysia marginata TaxID=1093978 RepID=A0AAV4HWR7_9GAST|nr:protein Wnt [Elysia marginata]
MRIVCKCHGVSGDCSVQVCWRKMKPFRRIGSLLKNKFDGASVVRWDNSRSKLKRITNLHKRPTKKDLVYLNESPDFCEFKPEKGSLGTRGRQCKKESPGLDGCKLMCCGRGYQTLIEEEVHDCDCKFLWCCEVRCKECRKLTEKQYCN